MSDFNLINKGGMKLYTVPVFDDTNLVKTGFSTRFGGVSEGRYKASNFSFINGDAIENVIRNYKLYCDALGVDFDKLVLTNQVHKDKVHVVTDSDIGAMSKKYTDMMDADALITNKKDVTLVKFSADCPIIYLLDVKNKAVGLVHSGWRSTEINIVGKTIDKMRENYESDAADLLAAIGPSIEACCFEVGKEVADIFLSRYGKEVIKSGYKKPHVDLKKVLTMQLIDKGVAKEKIFYSDICTGCNTEEFHSYRISKGECGLSIGTITLI
jgi:YfiH family protein